MPIGTSQVSTVKLSICITTFNRASFIGETLDSILSQLENNCEVVIVDGASTDGTEQVVRDYARRYNRLRYIKRPTNEGIDRDYDRTVQLARGEYCWLMSDDDLLKTGAIAKVLSALERDLSLLLVNYQRFDNSMSEVIVDRLLELEKDIMYGTDELDRLFSDTRELLVYIGTVIIKRSIWLARKREPYYDTMPLHIAVIFQEKLPGEALLIAEPLINYRDGNPRTFWIRMFEIFIVKFPRTVSSLAISDHEKRRFLSEDPKRTSALLMYRAMGWYSLKHYQRWISPHASSILQMSIPFLIAIMPGVLVNTYCLWVESIRFTRMRGLKILHLRMSPFYYRNCLSVRRRQVKAP